MTHYFVLAYGIALTIYLLRTIWSLNILTKRERQRREALQQRAKQLAASCQRAGSAVMSQILTVWTTDEGYDVQLEKMLNIVKGVVDP